MRGAAYSLWDVIYLAECGPRRRRELARAKPRRGGFIRALARVGSVRALRRSLQRRTAYTVLGIVFAGLASALLIGLSWALLHPISLGLALDLVGLPPPRELFIRLWLAICAVAMLTGVGSLLRPWETVARRVRPARRWRLWGYQAAAARRGPPDFLDLLGREHAARTTFWHQRLSASPSAGSEFVFLTLDPLAQRASVCVAAGFSLLVGVPALLGVQIAPHQSPAFPCLIGVAGWSPLILGFARRRSLARRLRRTLERACCPDCGYDLSAATPSLPGGSVPGAGPARCTECGSMWPLVPPPTDLA